MGIVTCILGEVVDPQFDGNDDTIGAMGIGLFSDVKVQVGEIVNDVAVHSGLDDAHRGMLHYPTRESAERAFKIRVDALKALGYRLAWRSCPISQRSAPLPEEKSIHGKPHGWFVEGRLAVIGRV